MSRVAARQQYVRITARQCELVGGDLSIRIDRHEDLPYHVFHDQRRKPGRIAVDEEGQRLIRKDLKGFNQKFLDVVFEFPDFTVGTSSL